MGKKEQKKRVAKARTKEKSVETAMMKPFSIQRSYMNTMQKLSNAGS
jgi:hypothetical protein